METFRLTWEKLCDCLHTCPRRIVTWYEGPQHRLRLSYYPKTGEMKLYLSRPLVEHGWEHLETYVWDDMRPKERAHKARAVLLAEKDRRFPEKPVEPSYPIPGCRGRLRVVGR